MKPGFKFHQNGLSSAPNPIEVQNVFKNIGDKVKVVDGRPESLWVVVVRLVQVLVILIADQVTISFCVYESFEQIEMSAQPGSN